MKNTVIRSLVLCVSAVKIFISIDPNFGNTPKEVLVLEESFFSLDILKSFHPGPGITRRAALAGQAMMTFFSFAPGSTVPMHAHPHDQLSVVVRGRAEFTVAGATRVLGPGEGAIMPGGTPHGVLILDEETEIWDAWAPPREDYR